MHDSDSLFGLPSERWRWPISQMLTVASSIPLQSGCLFAAEASCEHSQAVFVGVVRLMNIHFSAAFTRPSNHHRHRHSPRRYCCQAPNGKKTGRYPKVKRAAKLDTIVVPPPTVQPAETLFVDIQGKLRKA